MKKRLIACLLGIMMLAGSIGAAVYAKADGDPPPLCPPKICPAS